MWDPTRARVLGTSVRRLEDRRFTLGQGRYVSDSIGDQDLHVHFYRSPMAHGEIVSVDSGDARQVAGVVEVLTGEDLGLRPIPGGPHAPQDGRFDRPVLATGRVRYVGEPIAVIVAETKDAAVDAADDIWVDIEPLDAVTHPLSALDGPEIFDGGNVVERVEKGSALSGERYEISVSVTVENQRLAPVPLEGLAIRAQVEPGGRLQIACGHQAPHRLRQQLAYQLGLEQEEVVVTVPDVGGAFGLKGMLFPEYVVVAAIARRLGRPVSWIESRREHFVNGIHGRGHVHTVTLEGDREGRVRRALIEITADLGAYPHNGSLMPHLSTFVAQGLYDIEEVGVRLTSVVTNLAPVGSYRGAGRPEAAYAIERAMDVFAREVGLDPAVVRERNLVPSHRLPYENSTGATYDSGDYVAALRKALDLVEVAEVRAEQRRRLDHALDPIGLGIGAFVERAGGAAGTGEFGRVAVTLDGNLKVWTGSTSAGQGHETVWAQTISELFGVPVERVEVLSGDTDEVADGVGTYASRSAQVGASAVYRSGLEVQRRVREVASAMLEVSVEDLVMDQGRVHVVGDPTSGVGLDEVARRAVSEGVELASGEMFIPENQTFPYGVHVAVAEVELETGEVHILRYVAVDDCGRVLNPMIVEGQVQGSLVQGFGQAVLEGVEYSDAGDPLTTSLMDYLIPSARDVPEFTLGRLVHPAPSNPLGVKGTGEAGCIGAPPAIVNAVLDALAPYGVTDLSMPLRPSKVWQAIRDSRPG